MTEAVRLEGDTEGWQPILYSEANWLLFNVPGGGVQHVQNVQTGAWCLFRGMNAQCWETWRGKLYFGAPGGNVMQADVGGSDAGNAIRGTVHSAYNYLGSQYDKHFRLLRMHLESVGGGTSVSTGASVDFSRRTPVLSPVDLTQTGTAWDTAAWDSFGWGAGLARSRHWRTITAKGAAISIYLASTTTNDQVQWFSSDVLYDQIRGSISEAG